ncbi:MAG: two-component regulator propeller domain-containing protein, partial [Bacteroidota bacterium]
TATATVGISGASGVSRFRDGVWETLRSDETAIPGRAIESVAARPEGGALVGTSGRGLAVIDDDLSITVFDETNSSLRSATGEAAFVVVSDIVREGDLWWVVNKSSPLPLHVFPGTPEATVSDWTGLPAPPGGPSGVGADRIVLDEFGQKWLALGERGLLAWDTGSDPRSPSDDRGLTFSVGFNGQGLPNGTVTSLVLDREGRIWIGTRRGIAVVFSPGSAFGGDPALAEPVWPVTGEGEATDFLLRDASVNDLALDPAGRIWVATTSGAFLLTPAGDAIELQLTSADSPLPSDEVFNVEVDDRTGLVYFTTDAGLYRYQGDATGPDLTSESLRVSPSPFRPSQHTSLVISGLNAPTSRVRVLTVDGRTVFESDAVFGGSFRWDGRDARTGDLVPSGVYLVAASGANGESTLYGKIAIVQ